MADIELPVERWIAAQHPQYKHWCVLRISRDGGISSLGLGRDATETDAQAKLAEIQANGFCRECGDALYDSYMPKLKARIHAERMCFECIFWLDYIKVQGDPTHVIANGCHYTILPDQPSGYRGFLGHGGAEFSILFADGREVVTHNLWAQGSVPTRFRERMPNNAEFVQRGHRNIGAFAGYGGAGSADAECNT